MPDTPQRSPESPTNREEWVSVVAAAAAFGISARAIQKRCASGKMAARRVSTPGGVRWEVKANELDANPANFGREPANRNSSFGSRPGSFDAQRGANLDANTRTIGREPDGSTRELLEREREFSAFLKSQLEEANRNAQELRAALREALRTQPKQLPEGPTSGNFAQLETQKNAREELAQVSAKKSARIEQSGPQKGEAGKSGPGASNGARIEAQHEEHRFSSLGDVADWLEEITR